jgi:hypothetical protein
MKNISSFGLGILIFLSYANVFADSAPQYVLFRYNIHSINKAITDKQCQVLLNAPSYYDIINDKVVYKNSDSNVILSNYIRTNVAYIDKQHFLFNGSAQIAFSMLGKSRIAKQDISFVLNTMEQQVRGNFIIPGYCKGNIIGVDQNNNYWSPISSR